MTILQRTLTCSIAFIMAFAYCEQESAADEPVVNSVVYVKIALPVRHPYWKESKKSKHKNTSSTGAVENWITNKSMQIGQTKVRALTDWIPMKNGEFESTDLWDGWGCPVSGDVERTKDGKIKLWLAGFSPAGPNLRSNIVTSDVGSRGVALVDSGDPKKPYAYVGILVAPLVKTDTAKAKK